MKTSVSISRSDLKTPKQTREWNVGCGAFMVTRTPHSSFWWRACLTPPQSIWLPSCWNKAASWWNAGFQDNDVDRWMDGCIRTKVVVKSQNDEESCRWVLLLKEEIKKAEFNKENGINHENEQEERWRLSIYILSVDEASKADLCVMNLRYMLLLRLPPRAPFDMFANNETWRHR